MRTSLGRFIMLPQALCLFSLVVPAWTSSHRTPVWPQPALIEVGSDVVWLDSRLSASVSCGYEDHLTDVFEVSSPGTLTRYTEQVKQIAMGTYQGLQRNVFAIANKSTPVNDENLIPELVILRRATLQALADLHASIFVPWKFHTRHSSFEPDVTHRDWQLSSIKIVQALCPESSTSPQVFHSGDETYSIVVENETAVIETKSTVGTLRALETFKQLFYKHSSGQAAYTPFAPVRLQDTPRFSHRGLSLDIARNPFLPADALRTIDAMAMTKLNRLHLHATDSQAWPLEIPSLPDLARKGAYQPHLVWSARDLEEVQAYGDSRGIMVYIEIDMPGHTASIAQAYPELIAAYNELDWSTFAAEPQSGQLKLNSTAVYHFLDSLFADLLPRLSPHSNTYHLGGDEFNRAVHLLDETIQSDEHEILRHHVQRMFTHILNHTRKHRMRPVVWEEMVVDWDLQLPNDTLVQVWRNSERIEAVLKKGLPVIFGDYHHWYLDCGFGQFIDPYPNNVSPPGVPYNTSGGKISSLEPPYLDYCNPYHNWRDIWAFSPLANVSKELHGGIEGGEVLMWSEQTDSIDLDFKLWPRAAAAAEVLWAGPREPSMLYDATRRLGLWRERLVADKGIGSSPVTMTWCLMEGGCEL